MLIEKSKKEILLRTANTHELFLATHCLEQFVKYHSSLPHIPEMTVKETLVHIIENKLECTVRAPSKLSLEEKILAYSYYADFIRHLYNFYECVFQLSYNSKLLETTKKDLEKELSRVEKYHVFDKLLTEEVRKLLKNKAYKLQSVKGYSSTCQIAVPNDFGMHFRLARNTSSHVKSEPLESNQYYSMSNFFKSYHQFVYLLYQESQWLWPLQEGTLEEIEDFAINILNVTQ